MVPQRGNGFLLYGTDVFYIFVVPENKGTISVNVLVRWESGLIHQFAKLAYGFTVPGVRIPPSPQPSLVHLRTGLFCYSRKAFAPPSFPGTLFKNLYLYQTARPGAGA